MEYKAALRLVHLEMLLQNLSSLFYIIIRSSYKESLSDSKAKELKLTVNLIELIEELLCEILLIVERIV